MADNPEEEKKETSISEEEKKKQEIENANKEIVTIMPTMLDESEQGIEKEQDLSAIIPQGTNNDTSGSLELNSKEKELKSDGSLVLGTLTSDGEIENDKKIKELPQQINIAERKKEKDKYKGLSAEEVKKKKKKKLSKAGQKLQNRTSLLALLVIIGLGVFVYWFKNRATDEDFKPINLTVELGESLPVRKSAYVKPGIGTKVDELLYTIDTSEVNIEEVGDYSFTVTYNGITKTGTLSIVDTTPPELEVRNVTITEGTEFTPETFVSNCKDLSGCNYSFQNSNTVQENSSVGTHNIYIVATDAYDNKTTKQTTLIVENLGNKKVYTKETEFDFNTNYSLKETYELNFKANEDSTVLIRGIYTQVFKYQDSAKYDTALGTYSSDTTCETDDNNLEITCSKSISSVGSNYTEYNDIDSYLKKEGFTVK